MTPQEAAKYQLLGVISEAKPEEQQKVQTAAQKIRDIVKEGGGEAKVALSLVFLEITSDEDPNKW